MHDGQRLSLGDVTLEILATPGHTPESICIVVYEHADDAVPYGVLTGDTLFVGDVGRPDLLASAGAELSADALARHLYHSLHDKLLPLPDATRVFPAHGAGSSCGKQLSSETSSTLGEQRQTNYALQPMGEDEFVAAVTEGQPLRPHYFEFDARAQPASAPAARRGRRRRRSTIDEVLRRHAAGAVLLDAREPADFAAGHLRGAVNVGLQGRFAEWAGDVLAPDRDIVLVGDPAIAVEAKVRLARVGYDRVVGQLDDPAEVFTGRPDLIETSSRLTIEQLAELRGLEPGLQLVDVRSPAETAGGHAARRPRDPPRRCSPTRSPGSIPQASVVVYCASGYRSQIAASVLLEAGFARRLRPARRLRRLGGRRAADLDERRAPATSAPRPRSAPAPRRRSSTPARCSSTCASPTSGRPSMRPTAMLMPMGQVRARTAELPRDRRIVVVCRSGGRSAAVTDRCARGASTP